MLRIPLLLSCAAAIGLQANQAAAQTTMTPLATFGTGGWLAPGSTTFLGTGSLERGLAYNPQTGNLVLVSRSGGNNLRILNGTTGADQGALDVTGVTGGTFAVNMVDIAADGSIYVCNLSTSATSNFKVYRWASEAAGTSTPPTIAYDAGTTVPRTGDSFAVTGGSGGNPVLFAAAGSNSGTTSLNSYFVIGPVDGSNASTTYTAVAGTPTVNNGYRLGMTFVDQDTIIGTQGTDALMTSFSGSTATLDATIPLGGAPRRAMDHAVIGGAPILAVMDSNTSVVYLFDITTPAAPTLLASATTTSGALTANPNGAGSVQWGPISGNTATLYAMCTNQGIQAFQVTIQLPASARPYGAGCGSPALALTASAAPVLPSSITLDANNLPATTLAGFYVFGLVSIPAGQVIPVPPFCTQYLLPFYSTLFLPAGASSFQLPQTYPNDPSYAGLPIYVQVAAFDQSSDVLTSNGLRLYLETF